ncbi:MAG: amidohydrolase family protein [Candidatus Omnitrophica bacterium]|nr:amidohydrolase family protein [Candidatus Omnitrophota bacterium]
MIIDIHTHAWPNKVSRKAQEHLESSFRVKLVAEPTLDTLLRFMDRNNIEVSVVCAVATRVEQVPSINDWLFGIRSERIKVFCSLHPQYPQLKEEIKRVKEHGDGIKLQPEFQDFYIDDEIAFPMYSFAESLDIPVLFHCGEELSGTKMVRSSPRRLLNVKEKFPKLRIIAAHFGGFRLWEEVKKHLLGKDIYLDTSFFFSYLPREEVKAMILSHLPERIVFGTDFPLIDQKQDLDFLKSLEIPKELKERILSLNARQILVL